MSKSVFISGDNTHPLFHPFWEVREDFCRIFGEAPLAVTCESEHFETMEAEDYAAFDLVVLYSDHWIDKSPTVHQQVQSLLHYVATGGQLLVIHNFDPGVDPEMAQLLGGRLKHPLKAPSYEGPLSFRPLAHPACAGVEEFSFDDQLFAVTYDPLTRREEILAAVLPDGSSVPAGWSVSFGEGRACYLLPGHRAEAFRNEAYGKLLRQTALWMTAAEDGLKGRED